MRRVRGRAAAGGTITMRTDFIYLNENSYENLDEQRFEENGEILEASNKEKVWGKFPDPVWGKTCFFNFSNFENSIFPNLETRYFQIFEKITFSKS